MKMTLPNILSFSRLVISFFFFVFFISNDPFLQLIALILFLFGSITDYFDGYFARKYNLSSNLGKILDPLADKFLTISAFSSFVLLDLIPLWMLLIIIGRDLITTFMRTNSNKSISTSFGAKVKTTIQMIFIFASLLMIVWMNSFPNSIISSSLNVFLHSIYYDLMMLFIVLITIWTLIDYLKTK